ncbi:ribosome biogenesis GTPase YlqF [Alcanivorax sp. DP30]|uniref:ribosome biogenesis GTPase YlqF n=1 Tax=Alcanivorax sp. DP30 TaxID=2606217 RepID=UPI001371D7A5|nr:ribosome biogenesis GTPase YlqF [Alcanivorax sp. DP30]MZR63871.1 ribosome biogenesis GTPase YlqF [Alcanivorax sp. DP30]
MSINWFPGHMNKATREIREILPKVDLIIEVVDARLPYSSANPVIENFRADKPCLKLLSKSDLADPATTRQWLDHLQQDPTVRAMAITTQQPEPIRKLAETCKQMVHKKIDRATTITALITGIPNVGKSTLINTLAGRQVAKAGNEPAVTQRQQRIELGEGLILIDTPGILWAKIENPASGYRLALSGAIKATAMQDDDVALYAAEYLMDAYPALMKERFQLDTLPGEGVPFLETIGKQRGCLGRGGHVDFDRTATLLINEFRSGKLGQITLETPAMAEKEHVKVAEIRRQKAEEKEAKKQARKAAYKAKANKKD